MLLREIEREDLNTSYLELLNELSPSSHKVNFDKEWFTFNSNDDHYILVVSHHSRIVGTASLLLERKLDGRIAGHIEDVIVSRPQRSAGLGRMLINGLIEIAKREQCYKIVLNCSDKNIPFYSKFGFFYSDNGMKLIT